MTNDKNGTSQKIGCTVTSCAYNSKGRACSLGSITVEPCADCHSGKAEDESMCGSYRGKS